MEDNSLLSNGIPYPSFFGDEYAYVPFTFGDYDLLVLSFAYLLYEALFPFWIFYTFYMQSLYFDQF